MNDIKGNVMIIIPFPIIMHKYLYITANGFVGSVADVSLRFPIHERKKYRYQTKDSINVECVNQIDANKL